MDEITLRNFRCFRDEQTARLAPLTLLVGENSTGKTSFMAMVRALWELAFHDQIPDFKDPPYDLGSFDEIAHHRGARGSRAEEIFAAFKTRRRTSLAEGNRAEIIPEQWNTVPRSESAELPRSPSICASPEGKRGCNTSFGIDACGYDSGQSEDHGRLPVYDFPRGQRMDQTRELVPFGSTLRMLQAIESDEDNELETIEGGGRPWTRRLPESRAALATHAGS